MGINEQALLTARQKVGEYLKSRRQEKKLTYYAVAKLAGLSIEQVQSIEAGDKSYTIDSLLKITRALDTYLSLEDKGGKHLDFIDMAEKAILKKSGGKKNETKKMITTFVVLFLT
jgi:transcriptional regulator with XRE-family HTH domain